MAITITKSLKKAIPTVRLNDGVVKVWNIEVLYRESVSGWNKTYEFREDVEWMEKAPEDFTKAELLALVPQRNIQFEAAYEANNSAPTDETLSTFKVSDLT